MRKQLAFEGVSAPHVDISAAREQPRRGRLADARARVDETLIAASMAAISLVGSLMIADLLHLV